MVATQHLNPVQFEHEVNDKGIHRLDAVDDTGNSMGFMTWHSRANADSWGYKPGEIGMIGVEPEHQRKGIATALWHEGQKYDPQPVHGPFRTTAGDAWARRVGGRLPTADPETGARRYED